ncbi:hypothetical protein [Avibacterium paragallinarum]|uniref:hypothetical protein n=1 Tax=Avibacterium paragallinarum TaxID=728 RepID=UPI00397CB6EC
MVSNRACHIIILGYFAKVISDGAIAYGRQTLANATNSIANDLDPNDVVNVSQLKAVTSRVDASSRTINSHW